MNRTSRLRAITKPAEKPIGGLLDPRFTYIPAARTNVAATLERVRNEIASGKRKP